MPRQTVQTDAVRFGQASKAVPANNAYEAVTCFITWSDASLQCWETVVSCTLIVPVTRLQH